MQNKKAEDFTPLNTDQNKSTQVYSNQTFWPSFGKHWFFETREDNKVQDQVNDFELPVKTNLRNFSPVNSFVMDFDDFFHSLNRNNSCIPRIDLIEYSNSIVVKADVPGFSSSNLNVQLENDTIHISGEKFPENSSDVARYLLMERCAGKFSRSFNLPFNTKREGIESRLEAGVLEINIPKGQSQAHKIPIL